MALVVTALWSVVFFRARAAFTGLFLPAGGIVRHDRSEGALTSALSQTKEEKFGMKYAIISSGIIGIALARLGAFANQVAISNTFGPKTLAVPARNDFRCLRSAFASK
jgi:hypothetical protein